MAQSLSTSTTIRSDLLRDSDACDSASNSMPSGDDDHLHVRRVVELAQFDRGELGLRRTAPGEHVHVGDGGVGQHLVHVRRDVGGQQFLGAAGEHPGDVEADVADTDHGHRRAAADRSQVCSRSGCES